MPPLPKIGLLLQAKPTAFATSSSGTSRCEAQAVGKNGKPFNVAATTSFMKKCEAGDTSTASSICECKAVDTNGKPLAGPAKDAFMKKCVADAGEEDGKTASESA